MEKGAYHGSIVSDRSSGKQYLGAGGCQNHRGPKMTTIIMIDRSHSMRHSLPERLGVTRLTGVWQAIEQAGSKLLQQEKVFLRRG